jgi:hypothetical protein
LVRQHHPDFRIGDIEPFPGLPIDAHTRWLDGLQSTLAHNGIPGLDFYRLDVNWVVFTTEGKAGWPNVRMIQSMCQDRRIPFSLIYWASDYPLHKSHGIADNETWYTSIMAQGYNYAAVGGLPDQYVIQSWIKAPTAALPDDDPSTFTGSVLRFAHKFVK